MNRAALALGILIPFVWLMAYGAKLLADNPMPH